MVVRQEDKGTWPTQHFAFTVEEVDIEAAATALQQRGVGVEGPVYHEWMPAFGALRSGAGSLTSEQCERFIHRGAAEHAVGADR